jgi:nucleoside-diphosphate-sugar epimerase
MTQELTVVTGSTGKQGGAVARGRLERGHKVRAVTRDPNSSQAKLLANAGGRSLWRRSKTLRGSRRRSKERPLSSR